MELRRRIWAGLRFLGARAHGGIWGHGRDETLIAKVQRERRGGPRIGLGRTPIFKGHVEKLQSAKELEEEGAEVGGAMTLSVDSQSPCREGHRRAWMTR